ncbi:MAG: hypothetical protein EU548_04660, partial [Promethearchaeota archaeon]
MTPIQVFPQNPVWFSLKFINILRKHEKCAYKPSIRQAIAICKLLISRFMHRGICDIEDFIEIAVITSPLENKQLAKKIATEMLSYYKTSPQKISLNDLSGTEILDSL